MAGQRPDYILSALDKSTGEKGKVGVGWKNGNGRIGIRLNPRVVLTAGPNLVLTLFINTPYDESEPEESPIPLTGVHSTKDFDDDMPF